VREDHGVLLALHALDLFGEIEAGIDRSGY
jgi:hypothetical protein